MTFVKRKKCDYLYASNTFFEIVIMSTLQWSESLVLGVPFMDKAHHTFVDLLDMTLSSTDSALLAYWQDLIAHTDLLFDQEDAWMQGTQFSSNSCHAVQHKVILQVMREGEQRGQGGELGVLRQMAYELGLWFPQHVQSMDAALALHLRSAGFDGATGETLHSIGQRSVNQVSEQEPVILALVGGLQHEGGAQVFLGVNKEGGAGHAAPKIRTHRAGCAGHA
jgi:hemerythrin-like metal-binding protein